MARSELESRVNKRPRLDVDYDADSSEDENFLDPAENLHLQEFRSEQKGTSEETESVNIKEEEEQETRLTTVQAYVESNDETHFDEEYNPNAPSETQSTVSSAVCFVAVEEIAELVHVELVVLVDRLLVRLLHMRHVNGTAHCREKYKTFIKSYMYVHAHRLLLPGQHH